MNWGLIGYGEITPSFIYGLLAVGGQKLYAIASRSNNSKLNDFILYPDTIIYKTYEDLFRDTNVDIVYISTTNQLHKTNVIDALNHNKHVICEKPIGVCKHDINEMITVAKKNNKFLMEAMWTQFLPAYTYFKKLLKIKKIGEPNFVKVDFGFLSDWGTERRLLNKELYGGAVLDNCDYNIFLCQDVFQEFPEKISAFARYSETGVEDLCSVTLKYSTGGIAQTFCSFRQKTNQDAIIYGTKGQIHLREFWHGTKVEVINSSGRKISVFPFKKNGFEYEIQEVVNCIESGKLESNIIPLEKSLIISDIMDNILGEIKK